MSNNMMGAAFQYYAEVTGEKVAAAQERVVARGVLPNSRISPGYVRGEDGVLVVQRPTARVVVQAFGRRDRGASLVEIQALLAQNGIERSISGVASMLRSRMYLGEIHFGDSHSTRAHEPIIRDRALFERVQRRTVSRGRQAKSERLLARLGVLGCGTRGSRIVINSYSGNYRCGDTSANPCQRRAAVKADRVEENAHRRPRPTTRRATAATPRATSAAQPARSPIPSGDRSSRGLVARSTPASNALNASPGSRLTVPPSAARDASADRQPGPATAATPRARRPRQPPAPVACATAGPSTAPASPRPSGQPIDTATPSRPSGHPSSSPAHPAPHHAPHPGQPLAAPAPAEPPQRGCHGRLAGLLSPRPHEKLGTGEFSRTIV
jgi:hypothetical protein